MTTDSLSELRQALERLFGSMSVVWRTGTARRYHQRLSVETREGPDGAVRLPITNAIVRGRTALVESTLLSTQWSFDDVLPDGHGNIAALESGGIVDEEWDALRIAVMRDPELRRRLLISGLGWTQAKSRPAPRPVSTGGDTQYEDYDDYFDSVYIMSAFSACLAQFLRHEGYSANDFKKLTLGPNEAEKFVEFLSRALAEQLMRYQAIALVTSPPVDCLDPEEVWNGLVGSRTYRLAVAYPSDEMLGAALRDQGYGTIPPYSSTGFANASICLNYEVPFQSLGDGADAIHDEALELMRMAIDCLRLVCDGDIGVLHLVVSPTSPIACPFEWVLPEHPHGSYRKPMRRQYSESRVAPMTHDERTQWGVVFEAYRNLEYRKSGLGIAVDGFRDIYARYSEDDPRRIVETATALESLYLRDADAQELGFRMRLRAARLLGADLGERLEIDRIVRTLYDARSKIVHGAGIPARHVENADALAREGLGVLRNTLRRFITDRSLADGFKKSEFWSDLVLR